MDAAALGPAGLHETSLALGLELVPLWSSVGRVVAFELLGPDATLRALPIESALAEQVLPRAVAKRKAEFAAGRHAARLALARLGCFSGIGRANSGAPHWPTGYTGSISHGAGLAVAVVAPTQAIVGVGIDVERVISGEQQQEIAARIAKDDELSTLARALPERRAAEHVSLAFSAKESLYKCLNPLVERFFDFDAARVLRVDPDDEACGSITLELVQRLSHELDVGFTLAARYAFGVDRIETALWLPVHGSGDAK